MLDDYYDLNLNVLPAMSTCDRRPGRRTNLKRPDAPVPNGQKSRQLLARGASPSTHPHP